VGLGYSGVVVHRVLAGEHAVGSVVVVASRSLRRSRVIASRMMSRCRRAGTIDDNRWSRILLSARSTQ
jgi:hypothetical protein